MSRIISSSAACLILPCFSHYLINRTIFGGGGNTEHEMCALIFSTNVVWNFFILRRTERGMIKNVNVHVKHSLILPDCNQTWIFSLEFPKIREYQISSQSVHWRSSCSMRTGGRTDRHDEVNVALRNFANSPKRCTSRPNWGKKENPAFKYPRNSE